MRGEGWGWDGAGRSWQSWHWVGTPRSQLTAWPPAPQVAAVLTLPFDVVKTQRQIELGNSEVHPGEGPSSRQMPGGRKQDPPVGHVCPQTLTHSSPHSHSLQTFLHVAAPAANPRRVWHPGAVCR